MTSIIPNKNKKEKQRKTKRWPIVFWLMIWQAASVFVGQEILLASPAAVLKRLFTLVTEPVFWQSYCLGMEQGRWILPGSESSRRKKQ